MLLLLPLQQRVLLAKQPFGDSICSEILLASFWQGQRCSGPEEHQGIPVWA